MAAASYSSLSPRSDPVIPSERSLRCNAERSMPTKLAVREMLSLIHI